MENELAAVVSSTTSTGYPAYPSPVVYDSYHNGSGDLAMGEVNGPVAPLTPAAAGMGVVALSAGFPHHQAGFGSLEGNGALPPAADGGGTELPAADGGGTELPHGFAGGFALPEQCLSELEWESVDDAAAAALPPAAAGTGTEVPPGFARPRVFAHLPEPYGSDLQWEGESSHSVSVDDAAITQPVRSTDDDSTPSQSPLLTMSLRILECARRYREHMRNSSSEQAREGSRELVRTSEQLVRVLQVDADRRLAGLDPWDLSSDRRQFITSSRITKTPGGSWNEKNFTAIRGTAQQYVGAKKTYQFQFDENNITKHNKPKRTKHKHSWLMHEYYLLDPHSNNDLPGFVLEEDLVYREIVPVLDETGQSDQVPSANGESSGTARESHVWQYFTRIYNKAGKQVYAVCDDCDTILGAGTKTAGTSTLRRHKPTKEDPCCKRAQASHLPGRQVSS